MEEIGNKINETLNTKYVAFIPEELFDTAHLQTARAR